MIRVMVDRTGRATAARVPQDPSVLRPTVRGRRGRDPATVRSVKVVEVQDEGMISVKEAANDHGRSIGTKLSADTEELKKDQRKGIPENNGEFLEVSMLHVIWGR